MAKYYSLVAKYIVTYDLQYVAIFFFLTIATKKEVADNPLLIEQRNKQIEGRRSQYLWKEYPEVGLPSSIDETNPDVSLPVDEEFHRTKNINFLSDVFNGVVFNNFVVGPTLQVIDTIIKKALGIDSSTFKSANNLYIFEELVLRLMKDELENKEPESEITKGFGIKICQAHRWVTDEEFGRQILNGTNPVVIHKCTTLPGNFPVTDDMVKSSIVGDSLEKEMKVSKGCT